MANKIQLKRGVKANLPTLSAGEPAFTTDTKEIYVGDGTNNIRINPDFIDIRNLGAKCDGITDDTAVVQSAVSLANTLTIPYVYVPRNTVFNIDSLTIPSGIQIKQDTFTKRIYDYNPRSVDSSQMIVRNAKYTGGTHGYVNSALYVVDRVDTNVTAFEWGITSVMNNYATAGENVAIYGQGNKYGTGITWGGVFEARDYQDQLGNGLIGIEVDVFANGVDTTKRVGIDVVLGKHNSSGTAVQVYAGIRMGAVNGDANQGSYMNGFLAQGYMDSAININSTGAWGINMTGNLTIGIDFASSTISQNAIRLKSGQTIALEETGTVKMKYNSTSGNIEFYSGATLVGHIVVNGGADHAL